jgi:hypothetical protein
MNDATPKSTSDLQLNLHWPPETDALSGVRHVVVELQDTAGLAVASMSVPRDQLLQAFVRQLDHHPFATLDGFVSATFEDISFPQLVNPPIALYQLVADAVSPDMLEDEPEAANMFEPHRVYRRPST